VKVLHLFGDWKWTGPSEPTLDLVAELRALGADVTLACPRAPEDASTNLPARARALGLEPDHSFALNRSFNLRDNLADIGRVREIADRRKLDVLHVHFTHDHIIGAMGARRAKHRPKVVRTNHKAAALPWYLRAWTDGYLTFSKDDLARERLTGPSRHINPGMRLDRFDPDTRLENMRERFDVAKDDFVVGVVARMQKHRRFDVLLAGVAKARKRVPHLRVLVVGRGTHMEQVAVRPATRLGLDRTVTFTGHVSAKAGAGADPYPALVASFDALLYLVPGSDGTCRAIREAMAMGKPVIGARRGLIPEFVEDGWNGFVIDDTPETIAASIERLASDRALARAMGRHGREKALASYDIRRQARDVLDFYRALVR